MARNPGKQYQAARKQVEAKEYLLEEAVPLLKKIKYAKFDETVEIHMRLGVDPKHADQMVRGTVVMPNGLGKSKKVLVIASGDKQREATEAGADLVGGEDMVNKIQSESWTDFDAVIATPDMMRSVGKLGKILGPRGLMPNPKTGTVTVDVAKAVNPQRHVVAVSGDGGFLMNCQELETAVRLRTAVVNVVWENGQFGSIAWKQDKKFGRPFAAALG